MTAPPPALGPLFEQREFARPVTIQFTGESRIAVNLAAHECARRINPGYLWLEIRDDAEPVDPREPSGRGVVPPGQWLTTDRPEALAPAHPVSDLSLWTVLRTGESPSEVGRLVDFLRLPEMIQAQFPELSRAREPAAFAVVNGDRISGLYPDDVTSSRGLLEVFTRERITFVLGFRGEARADRFAFDYVFRIEAGAGEDDRSRRAICEKAPPGSAFELGRSYDVDTR